MQSPMPTTVTAVPTFPAPSPALVLRERRRDNRGPVMKPGKLTVLDGAHAGEGFDVQTRDLSLAGVSFLLRVPLAVGQRVMLQNGVGRARSAEIVRSRPLSNGKH